MLKVTVAPPDGARPVRSMLPRASPPLNFWVGKVTAPMPRGWLATVKVPVADQSV